MHLLTIILQSLRKGYRTPSLANLVANEMKDDNTTAAIRLIFSEEKPVYDSEEVYVKLTE